QVPITSPVHSPVDEVVEAILVEEDGEPGDSGRTLGSLPTADRIAPRASADIREALLTMIRNPVGGLADAYNGLGPMRALILGVVLLTAFELSCVLGAWVFHSRLVGAFPGDFSFPEPSTVTPGKPSRPPSVRDRDTKVSFIFKVALMGGVQALGFVLG